MKNIQILYEDEQFVVFDKPTGLLVTPAPGKDQKVFTDIVNEQYDDGRGRLHPCHRLDQMTSGAIIYARGKNNQQCMREIFHDGDIQKTYFAFVKGRVKEKKGTIQSTIKDFHQKKFAGQSRGKLAITHYQVVSYEKGFTVVKVQPKTGRTNQIRIHFAEIGHPLLGERVYAFRRDFNVDMKRLALHSYALRFINPVTEKTISVVSEMPQDMKEFLSSVCDN